MTLRELPDAKPIRALLTLGRDYQPIRHFGDAVVILCDDGETKAIVLSSRFEKEDT